MKKEDSENFFVEGVGGQVVSKHGKLSSEKITIFAVLSVPEAKIPAFSWYNKR